MRWLVPTFMMICSAAGYAQETCGETTEATEVVQTVPESDEVAVAPADEALHAGTKCPCSGGNKGGGKKG